MRSDTSTNHTRSNSDARLRVALPSALVQQLQKIAAADSLTLSSTARRLLSRAVAREYAQQVSGACAIDGEHLITTTAQGECR